VKINKGTDETVGSVKIYLPGHICPIPRCHFALVWCLSRSRTLSFSVHIIRATFAQIAGHIDLCQLAPKLPRCTSEQVDISQYEQLSAWMLLLCVQAKIK
jgi:hypothetical protein